jgi:putative transposase
MNRAEPPTTLLRGEADGLAYLDLVGAMAATSRLEVHAYCLLERHYHLLVRAVRDSLGRAVRRFEEAWAERLQADCRKDERPRLTTKCRLLPVQVGRHLAEVSRYIHLNPFEAGLSFRPEDWPHSSYRGYLGDLGAPQWLHTGAVLARFGSIGARHRYRAFVEAGMDPGTRDADGRPRWGALFREGSLAEDLAWRVEPLLPARPGPADPRRGGAPPSLGSLARTVAGVFGTSAEALRSQRRGGCPTVALARGAVVHAARGTECCRLRDVAAWLGYASPRAAAVAAARAERALATDPALAARIEKALGRRPCR